MEMSHTSFLLLFSLFSFLLSPFSFSLSPLYAPILLSLFSTRFALISDFSSLQRQSKPRRVSYLACRSKPCQSSRNLHLRPFPLPIMHFSAATCCLASLVATLVEFTSSLPQSPSGSLDGILSSRKGPAEDPLYHQPPVHCFRVGAIYHQLDIGQVVERDSQPPETHAGVDPRSSPHLPCGMVVPGEPSNQFVFKTARTLRLFWEFEGVALRTQLVSIVQVDPQGVDRTVAVILQ